MQLNTGLLTEYYYGRLSKVAKIKPYGSVKVTIEDGALSTSLIKIEGWLSIDYNKYLAGHSLLECLILNADPAISNFPIPE
jgi:hypothetical protein